MALDANRGQPPGELAQTGIGATITIAFEFSNGIADVLVGLVAGDQELTFSFHPLVFSLKALDASRSPAVCSTTVDVLTRVGGGAFTSITASAKPALSTQSEVVDQPCTGWSDIVLGESPIGLLETLTLGPAPKKLTLSVKGTVV